MKNLALPEGFKENDQDVCVGSLSEVGKFLPVFLLGSGLVYI